MLVSCNPRTTLENEKVSKQFVFGGTMCFELDIRSVLVSSHSFSLCSLFFLSSMEQFPPDVLCHSVALIKKCLLPSSSLLCSRQEVQQMMFPVRKSMQGIGISAFHKNSPVDAINNKTSLVYITTVVIHSLVSYLHCYLRTKLSHLCPMQNL